LSFTYTATGTFSATGLLTAAGQLDFAVLNPDTPGDRSSWLVDHPVFLSPGNVSVTDSATVSFFEDQPFVFWPIFGVVARKVANGDGQSDMDFSHSLVFNSFAVLDPGGAPTAFSIDAESGLIYSGGGLAAVPEPATSGLLAGGAAVLWAIRRRSRARRD
jgi:hypothetical protein